MKSLPFAMIGLLCLAVLVATPEAYMRGESRAKTAPNSPPVAVNDSYSVHGGTQLGDLLANDFDPDGGGIAFASYGSLPQHGELYGSNLAIPS